MSKTILKDKIGFKELDNSLKKARFFNAPLKFSLVQDFEIEGNFELMVFSKDDELLTFIKGAQSVYDFLEGVIYTSFYLFLKDNSEQEINL